MPITPETDISDRGWRVRGAGDSIRVHPGVAISELVRAQGALASVPSIDPVPSDAVVGKHFELQIEAVYSASLGHYLLRSFALDAGDDDETEVTGTLLRAVAPLGIMRWLLPRTFEIDASALSLPVVDFIAPEMAPYRQRALPGQSKGIALEDVGTVYSLARVVRYPPAKAVAESFGLQPRTATNWIVKARAAGFI